MNHHPIFKFLTLFAVAVVVANGSNNLPVQAAQSTVPSLELAGANAIAEKLYQQCVQDLEDLRPELAKIEAALQSNDPEAINVRTIGKSYAKARSVARSGSVLESMGHSAGIDFRFQGTAATDLYQKAATTAGSTTAGKKISEQAPDYQNKTAARRKKSIEALQRLIDEPALLEAEEKLRDVRLDVDSFIIWLNPSRFKQLSNEFNVVVPAIYGPLKNQREEEAKERVLAALKQLSLDKAPLIASITSAASDIKKSGVTELTNGTDEATTQADGPTAFSHFAEQWIRARQNLQNAAGLEATAHILRTPIGELLGAESQAQTWAQADLELQTAFETALVEIIQSDTAHVQPADVPALYAQYIKNISQANLSSTNESFVASCQTALNTMAQKNSQFSQAVENYREATDDLLRWRRRLARSAASSLSEPDASPAALIGEQECTPQLKTGLHEIAAELADKVGSQTTLKNLHGLLASASYSSVDQRVWASVQFDPTKKQAAIDLLQSDLMVSPTQPALTLDAAAAIVSAERSDFEAVGGTIKTIVPEALSTRLIQIKPGMVSLFPIGQLPEKKVRLDDMLLRVSVEPKWLQHQYFFVRVD